jgi:hypothetical protein
MWSTSTMSDTGELAPGLPALTHPVLLDGQSIAPSAATDRTIKVEEPQPEPRVHADPEQRRVREVLTFTGVPWSKDFLARAERGALAAIAAKARSLDEPRIRITGAGLLLRFFSEMRVDTVKSSLVELGVDANWIETDARTEFSSAALWAEVSVELSGVRKPK